MRSYPNLFLSLQATPSNQLRCCPLPTDAKPLPAIFLLLRLYGPNRTRGYHGLTCGRDFSSRHASIFSGFHTDEETIYGLLKALAEGKGRRACARIFDIDTKTVALILDTAARQCKPLSEQLIKNYHMDQCQLDELWSFVKKRKRISRHLNKWQPAMATNGCGSGLSRAIK